MEVANIRKVIELSSPALLLYVTKHVFIQQKYIIYVFKTSLYMCKLEG